MSKLNVFLFSLLVLCNCASANLKESQKQNVSSPISLIKNGGFENNFGNWQVLKANVSLETANPLYGKASGKWDPTATTQGLYSEAATIPKGMQGKLCEARVNYLWESGTNGDITFSVSDGTSTIAGPVDLVQTQGDSTQKELVFSCPTSGTLQVQLDSTANAAEITVDKVHLGEAFTKEIKQNAGFAGSISWIPTSACAWENTTITMQAFASDVQCDDSARTLEGSAVDVSAGQQPEIEIPDMGPGHYEVVAYGELGCISTSAVNACGAVFSFNDGTNYSSQNEVEVAKDGTAVNISADGSTAHGEFDYATASGTGTRTFELHGRARGANGKATINVGGVSGFKIKVYYYPNAPVVTALDLDTQDWNVDVNIYDAGGGRTDLSTGAFSTYTGINDNLTIEVAPHSKPVEIGCSGVQTPTGATCGSSESVAIGVNVPTAGLYEACYQFAHFMAVSAGSGNGGGAATFQPIETEYNSQVILQESKARMSHITSLARDGTNQVQDSGIMNLCGKFDFTSSGKKMIRLMREQGVCTSCAEHSLLTDRSASIGQRDIKFTMRKLTEGKPMPVVLVNANPWQMKELDGDATSDADADFADIGFSNLTIGKVYEVFLKTHFFCNATDSYGHILINHDGSALDYLKHGINATTAETTPTIKVTFKATASTVTFSGLSLSANCFVGGGAGETRATIVELNTHHQTESTSF